MAKKMKAIMKKGDIGDIIIGHAYTATTCLTEVADQLMVTCTTLPLAPWFEPRRRKPLFRTLTPRLTQMQGLYDTHTT